MLLSFYVYCILRPGFESNCHVFCDNNILFVHLFIQGVAKSPDILRVLATRWHFHTMMCRWQTAATGPELDACAWAARQFVTARRALWRARDRSLRNDISGRFIAHTPTIRERFHAHLLTSFATSGQQPIDFLLAIESHVNSEEGGGAENAGVENAGAITHRNPSGEKNYKIP